MKARILVPGAGRDVVQSRPTGHAVRSVWGRLGITCTRLLHERRGVSAVEYALLLVAILLVVAAGYRALGGKTTNIAAKTAIVLGGNADFVSVGEGTGHGGSGGAGGDETSGNPGDGCTDGVCLAPGNCFVAGTPVATPSGERSIESLRVGDTVLARGEFDDQVAPRTIRATFARPAPSLVNVRVVMVDGASENIRSTPEHPYWTLDRGWVRASALAANEALLDRSGHEVHVANVVAIALETTVYNVEVDGAHTYFVGRTGILVHNECTLTPAEANAIKVYTGPAYAEINEELRNDDVVDYKKVVTDLKSALEKAPKCPSSTVYRGVSFPPEVLNNYQPGKTVTEPTFNSSSVSQATAESFMSGKYQPVLFTIKQKNGKNVQTWSTNSHEGECLFAPDTKFKVTGRSEVPGEEATVTHITLEEE